MAYKFNPLTGRLELAWQEPLVSGVTVRSVNGQSLLGAGDLVVTSDVATKLTTARTISLSGGVTGSVSFDGSQNVTIATTVTNDGHSHTVLTAIDDRDIKPADTGASGSKALKAYFTSLAGLNGAADADYQDFLVLDTYSDATGGKPNALAFDKSEMKVRHYQPAWNGTVWGTPKTFAYVEDVVANATYTASDVLTKIKTVDGEGSGLDADLLDGQQGSYYLNWDNLTGKPTAFAPSAHSHTISDVTGLQTALDGKAVTSHTHADATTSAAGFMSSADKTKLDGVATGANNYSHPTGDGNLHVPATGTTNNGKVLKAGSTAGSLSWGTLTASDVGAATSSHNHDASYPTLAAFNALADRVAALENIIANGAVHWDGKLALR